MARKTNSVGTTLLVADGNGADEEHEGSFARRAVVIGALVAAVVVAWSVLTGGTEYTLTARFENASQLVPGNTVVVGGLKAGSVKTIELGPNGEALVTFTVSDDYAPLRRGTVATVRSYSFSGLAGRQIQLTIPPDSEAGDEIPAGGQLDQSETVSEVDLDEVFNTLDPKTVADFKHVIQGFDASYEGVGEEANKGAHYLNPFLSTSRGLFAELTYDERAFENLIVDTSKLSGALAARAPDISALIGNVSQMMGAIGSEKTALAEGISKFPAFMRSANTTFVNLRAALDDVDPLVEASKPAAEELKVFLPKLRAALGDAVPTVRDLDAIVLRPGSDNDLVELTKDQVGLAQKAIGSGAPDCGGGDLSDPDNGAGDDNYNQGAFGESVCALRNGTPTLSMFRPYTPDLVGWFDDFSHPGTIDALGGVGRISTSFNQFSPSAAGVPDLGSPVDFSDLIANGTVQTGLDDKCPGSEERPIPSNLNPDGNNPFTDGGNIDCDPNDVLREP